MHKITVVALTFTTALLSDTLANAADFPREVAFAGISADAIRPLIPGPPQARAPYGRL